MTASVQSPTPQSSVEEYAARRSRALEAATDAGLSGILVAPGPDLVWLTGYRPTAITERPRAAVPGGG
jgi:hypothetical protein